MQRIKITGGVIERESDSLVRYLAEIKKVRLLTADEECDAIQQFRAGNTDAFEKIVRANLRFVVAIARRYQYQGISLQDLISEGNIGLMRAIEKYDETRGFKFMSYAIWWIRQSIVRALTEHSRLIHLPRNKVSALHKLTQLFRQLEQEFEREPSLEELSDLTGFRAEAVKVTLLCRINHISIDAPVAVDDTSSLLDMIEDVNAELPDHRIAEKEPLATAIRLLLAALNKNQSEVVKMYYGIEGEEQMNHYEIGRKLNVSSERVRQIKEAALSRIKKSHHCQRLQEHVV